MSEFYLKSIDRRWKKEVALATEAVILLSPYLTSNTADLVLRQADPEITRIYTVFSFSNFALGASSLKTLKQLKETGIQLFHLEKLHAKVLIVDNRFASLGSQNLTFGGTRNKEASIVILDALEITELRQLVEEWIDEAIPITEDMICRAEQLVNPLQEKTQPIIDEIVDTEKKYWYKLKLDQMQSRVPKVHRNLERFSSNAGDRNIDLATARLFIRNSAWWFDHPCGRPVRAPDHQYRIYGSNPDWRIDFGANQFLVGRAIQRCLNIIENTLEEIAAGKVVNLQNTRDRMFNAVKGAVANYNGDEYLRYYTAIYGNDMKFGTQSIDISDFVSCAISLTEFDSIFA